MGACSVKIIKLQSLSRASSSADLIIKREPNESAKIDRKIEINED